MGMFDLGNAINVQTAVETKLVAANVNATAIDTAGFQETAFILTMGTIINGTPAARLSILVGEDTNVSNAVAINTNYITRTASNLSTANTSVIYGIGPLGNTQDTRYVFPNLVVGASNSTIGVIAVQRASVIPNA